MPDTFGHVQQLPQILRGFGIETFYAMRGLARGRRHVRQPVLVGGAGRLPGADRVAQRELLERGRPRRRAGADAAAPRRPRPLRLPARAAAAGCCRGPPPVPCSCSTAVTTCACSATSPPWSPPWTPASRPPSGSAASRSSTSSSPPGRCRETVVRGELRYGRSHAVFDGIGSTRTPMKALNERTEAHLTGVAERLDALATLVDGRSSLDSLRHAWRELIKNYAHDSICGCSVDEVHDEMVTRLTTIGQTTSAVAEDALARIAVRAAPACGPDEIPVVVVNPSGFARSGPVSVDVLPDLDAPVGERRFGWTQGAGRGPEHATPWSTPTARTSSSPASRRRGCGSPTCSTGARSCSWTRSASPPASVPALGVAGVPPGAPTRRLRRDAGTTRSRPRGPPTAERLVLDNGILRVEVEDGGTIALTDLRSGTRFSGLLGLVDEADAGDEYGFAPCRRTSRSPATPTTWSARARSRRRHPRRAAPAGAAGRSGARTVRAGRTDTVDVGVTYTLRLGSGRRPCGRRRRGRQPGPGPPAPAALPHRAADRRRRWPSPRSAWSGATGGVPDADGLDGPAHRRLRDAPLRRDRARAASGCRSSPRGCTSTPAPPDGTVAAHAAALGGVAGPGRPPAAPLQGRAGDPHAGSAVPGHAPVPVRPAAVLRPAGASGTSTAPPRSSRSRCRPSPPGAGRRAATARPPRRWGCRSDPEDVVLSAVKTSEDRPRACWCASSTAPTTRSRRCCDPRSRLESAERCDLEERSRSPLPVAGRRLGGALAAARRDRQRPAPPVRIGTRKVEGR